MEELKVAAKSNPNSIAGIISALIDEGHKKIALIGIGAGALNQAIKASIIARGFVAPKGIDLVFVPAFTKVIVEGEERTGIKLIVEVR